MDDEGRLSRVCEGRTEAPRAGHGIEVSFEALPATWAGGDEVDVIFPDGARLHLLAEPEHGPTTFAWVRDPRVTWLVRLEPLRVNVLALCLDEVQRDITDREG